jgi:7,8-didemethyl-8-hydroxy-5-deazariboflavin synthase
MNLSKGRERKILDMMINTSNTAVSEILAKSLERQTISKIDAYTLINSEEDDLIISTAKIIRDQIKPSTITYSRKVFINLVNLCRDTCSYCTYKKEPSEKLVSMMMPSQVLTIAETGKRFRCTEALFVTGERPEQKYPEARVWLKSIGHSSTVEYIREISEVVLKKTGLLPHTNAGTLTKREMSLLKDTNVSLGLMLESSSARLMKKGMPHEMAPSKNPKARIKTLENAGELKIPITTGLLIGIGESPEDVIDSLFVIREIHRKYDHIQELIMQNFVPNPESRMAKFVPPSHDYFLKSVALARIIIPEMNIQVPPNLSPNIFGKYIDAGINDWGGISPITIDHVNPEFPWPTIESIKCATKIKGYDLRARLPVYPEFIHKEDFILDKLKIYIDPLLDTAGLVREDYIN